MASKLTGTDGPVLGMRSSLDIFEKLKHESARLQKGWHPYDAFNFLVTAWHLFEDWPQSDPPNALNRMKRQRRRLPPEMNFLLDIVRDLVNGSKHFKLNPDSANKRRIVETHSGQEVGWYELMFHENLPAVTAGENFYISIRVINNIITRYFEWVFDDKSSLNNFPKELTDAISYCDVASRSGKTTPAIWLLGIDSAYSD